MPARFDDVTAKKGRMPTPLDLESDQSTYQKLPDEIVISGISGRFPESSSIEEFKANLFNGVDMVNDDPRRWPNGLHDLPSRLGKIKTDDLEKFDLQFFGVHQKLAECMDPQMKMLLEATHEAIIDAGVNPQELRGTRTGVYIGVSSSETEDYLLADANRVNGYGLIGCQRSMMANRISYSFDFKGPSYAIDTACSSSLYALSQAFTDIKNGICDSAIVGGSNLLLIPTISLQFNRLGMLSANGKCNAFDESGSGYVRSDGCAVIFLQKTSRARRVYATILNVRTNTDGGKDKSITYPSGEMQCRLIAETYDEIGLHPRDVVYVEAHGTGTQVGDSQEVNSITDFFCKDRTNPLLIGAVKSNMGHSEPASGVCSIAKVLLAMEAGVIPGNLHYKVPNSDLHGIIDGRLKVVDRNTPWNGGIVGLNSFGFGGANAHVILKSNRKQKTMTTNDQIPHLVVVSGRTRHAVNLLLEEIEKNANDTEFLSLINEIHSKNIPMHNYRGYIVVNGDAADPNNREVHEVPTEKRPIWFNYTGFGTQWACMAKDLMVLEPFRNTINRCADVLRPFGYDLIEKILINSDESTFDHIINSGVSIISVQIALTDVLAHLGIIPDGIMGESLGEISCGYADGCSTLEQAILATYWIGRCVIDSNLQPGMMAVVSLSWEEALARIPADIELVSHIGEKNVTISGLPESVTKFMNELIADGIFAQKINSSGYAFHSKYVAAAAPEIRTALEKIFPNPQPRSPRWLSTSLREEDWSSPIARTNSAAYHVNNFLSKVYGQETLQHLPKNAICIEIAPDVMAVSVLKRYLRDKGVVLSLNKSEHPNNAVFFLQNIGKLYAAGAQPQISKLYEPVSYPVGRGTPMLNSKIGWKHVQRFPIRKYASNAPTTETIVEVNLSKPSDSYLIGHKIDGRILFPASGYLTMVWRAFAKRNNTDFEKTAVIFENIVFHRATILSKDGSVKFAINFLDGTGQFDICEGNSLTVSGKISVFDDTVHESLSLPPLEQDKSGLALTTDDIYMDLGLRGYDYGGKFCGITLSDSKAVAGKLKWQENWVSFIDTMFQFCILGRDLRELYVPVHFERISINPIKHLEIVQSGTDVPIYMYKNLNIFNAGGVEVRGYKFALAPRHSGTFHPPTLERYIYVPLNNADEDLGNTVEVARLNAITAATHLAIENSGGAFKIKVTDVVEGKKIETTLAKIIESIIESEPQLTSEIAYVTSQSKNEYEHVIVKDPRTGPVESNSHLIVAYDVIARTDATNILRNLKASIRENGFILLEENIFDYDKTKPKKLFANLNLAIVSLQCATDKYYVLLRPRIDINARNKLVIYLTESDFSYVEQLKSAFATAEEDGTYVYIVAQGEQLSGACGFMNCLKLENGGQLARLFFIQNDDAEGFSFTNKAYEEQLKMDLMFNVYKNGEWGTYRHLKLNCASNKNSVRQVEHAHVDTLTKGDLTSLSWIESRLTCQMPDPMDKRVELCSVYYAPINFRDVMLSTGKLAIDALPGNLPTHDCILGLEFSGRDSSGKRIMAMVEAKSLATTCVAQRNMMWEVPSDWTMEEASTVPCVYSTVYYALVVRGKMKKGESILIHAGSGGVGQAAIRVALHHGLTVYTTVGSKVKRTFLKKTFPQLTDAHIGNSRDTSFEQFIRNATNGKGVDLILNSLADEMLKASVRCLGLNGRFLEIGKFDLNNNSPLGMSVFLKNTSFHGILLDSIMASDDGTIETVVDLVAEGIKNGAVRPLPTTVFSDKQVQQAFRFMAGGKHIGKVVIKVRNEEFRAAQKPVPKQIAAIPRTYFHSEKSYVLVGGLGGLGLEMANWMVKRGATKLVLTSRSGVKTGYQSLMIRRWIEKGVNVLVDTNDITTLVGAENLLKEANKLGPVAGIFNLAGILRVNLLKNQTEDDYKAVCMPKINGTKHLDTVSRELCPGLKHFVCFSSIASGRGLRGQTNYGLANSAMERICESRQAAGLPGTAIQWGAIGDTGMFINHTGDNDSVFEGVLPQRITSVLQAIDVFMQQSDAVLSSMVVAEKNKDISSDLSLVDCVASILEIKDIASISDQTPFVSLGMDSLISADIKQRLERNYDIFLSETEISQLTFGKLKAMAETK
ncbi:fatty acid synthase-like [Contarinia nasturtii]|uniref:fatty acid synthase-like n=1 Tax=Contarinia nasturtii TaxID=265458 RepID=UPI0012D4B807|nr:fatty acid synthase-like [Contarinia nasturtii]